MDGAEASLNASERQCAELREKTAALGKAKVGAGVPIPAALEPDHALPAMCAV